jgi:hypothetical protein
MKLLDLSTELVVLDWVYEPTLDHVAALVRESASSGDPEKLTKYAFRLGLRILDRVGFGPLSRPTFLRIGFRDICRDFDLHEGTSIRLVLGRGRLTRAHLDYDACALVFRTAFHEPDPPFEHALVEAFPHAEVRRLVPAGEADALNYEVRHTLPATLVEAREALGSMRLGLATLMARFEPDRFHSVGRLLETFGARETLAGLRAAEPRSHAVRVMPAAPGSTSVH